MHTIYLVPGAVRHTRHLQKRKEKSGANGASAKEAHHRHRQHQNTPELLTSKPTQRTFSLFFPNRRGPYDSVGLTRQRRMSPLLDRSGNAQNLEQKIKKSGIDHKKIGTEDQKHGDDKYNIFGVEHQPNATDTKLLCNWRTKDVLQNSRNHKKWWTKYRTRTPKNGPIPMIQTSKQPLPFHPKLSSGREVGGGTDDRATTAAVAYRSRRLLACKELTKHNIWGYVTDGWTHPRWFAYTTYGWLNHRWLTKPQTVAQTTDGWLHRKCLTKHRWLTIPQMVHYTTYGRP